MKKRNFLLGKGERLAEQIKGTTGGSPKIHPYTFDQAKQRLTPMIQKVANELDKLPANACPNDQVVATLTLNPEYIAKSYYPGDLLRAIGLETVGSRAKKITPEKRSKEREPVESITTELFVKGSRESFRKWAAGISSMNEMQSGSQSLIAIESISAPKSSEKIFSGKNVKNTTVYEIVLHLNEESAEQLYLGKFRSYLNQLKVTSKLERRFYAGGLCFIELEASNTDIQEVAKFSLVRAIRIMPSLRLLKPAIRTSKVSEKIKLPTGNAIDPSIKVAIFDGGLPKNHPLTKWANPIDAPGVGPSENELLNHGIGVTSAFLFGPIDPKIKIENPYSNLDHYRVLDNIPGQNNYELYEVLERIENILKTKKYDFINLSLGPNLPITDDEVHAWTAVLDEYLASGQTLATVAVGNDGDGYPGIGGNRIQVPADCVNALGIGSCDVPDNDWQRAPYSSIGPGRSPGIVKPNLVNFGGSIGRPFLVVDETGNKLAATGGTSFAAPSTMRMGVGVRAHFGSSLSSLAIHTLLVHCAESCELPKSEVGWGRVARELDDMVVCGDNEVRVVFQGSISASKYVRIPVPVPALPLTGKVVIKATLCYATEVDPHHPSNYTRCGLEPIFRPNMQKRTKPEQLHPNSKNFFGKSEKGLSEEELRRDAFKWENCHHASNSFLASSLDNPAFDIHYNARLEGHNDNTTKEIQYAFIVTVKATKVADLYNQVVRRYATQLEAIQPVIDIPIRV